MQLCAASVMQMTDEKDIQGQVLMNSSGMPEHATKFKMKKLEEDHFKTETELTRTSRLTLLAQEMTKPETTTTAPASIYQTESDCSTTLTRSVKEIAEMSKIIITKPIQVLCSQSETRWVSKMTNWEADRVPGEKKR